MSGGHGRRPVARPGPGGTEESSRWTRGSTAAVFLNLTGLGLGYAYLHRWWRWGFYLSVLLGIATAAYWTSDARVAPAWAVVAALWVAFSVADGWRMATRTIASGTVAIGASAIPLVVAVVLLVGETSGFWLYRSAGNPPLPRGGTLIEPVIAAPQSNTTNA